MRVGIISDTHVKNKEDLKRLEEIVNHYFVGVDMILHAGDMVDLRALEILRRVAQTVAVRGNMDFPETKQVLPEKTVVEAAGCKIGLIHGWSPAAGLPQRVRKEFKNVDCIVFGHSHEAFNRDIDGVLLFNPGSPMDRAFNTQNSVGFLNINQSAEERCDKIFGEIVKI
ncbi:metallophosphoesterase family protein [Candidatus Oleimmundimicrobium sp.]|uniref:metallophosphoesterase family protein n=1 Tax=Candidatus Oleimmundimicrobium sp. TaxID=3060597 RepID=UPI00271E78B3|nr:metallophosphoesterase family protein [Candidatus Oleimmundimicrobium sp.]MDO8885635.1 metallophosphoesterase family protein [Candidatus Oleimmundimicrobium sp.]